MPGTNGPKIIVSLWVMTVVPLFFMLPRFRVKRRYSKLVGWDDYLLALSWVFILIYTVLTHVSVGYGIGKHLVDTDPVKIVDGIKFMYLGEIFALFAMPTSKTSFCVTLLRLTATQWHKWFIWFIIITINLTLWLCAILTLAQCSPVEKLWNIALPGTCWDNRIVINYSIFVGVWSCLMDLLLTVVPWLTIWNLQMNKREKVGVIVTMSLGCLAGVTCAVKTSYLPSVGTWQDFTFNTAEVLIWGLSESAITIVAASIPFLRVLVREASSKGGSGPYHHSDTTQSAQTNRTNSLSCKSRPNGYGNPERKNGYEGSDKSILGEPEEYLGAIVKTNEVRIEYAEGSDEENRGGMYEKGRKQVFKYGTAL
ncbi:hypothetical protein K469DRAFT_680029 [Zopfia rhizophila CBS 207.26]|uniref:Rhodopsin domain-containing protein n=1 Tax=Zopfia rhizophila CBS 207.26 TaxID=1314779 RepID=A0A6A6D8P6_9PEZI|nr:hypothetical protein K469DRAFT_680029 [Zopfia rhizophila CBS 207.26]